MFLGKYKRKYFPDTHSYVELWIHRPICVFAGESTFHFFHIEAFLFSLCFLNKEKEEQDLTIYVNCLLQRQTL